jgi:TRAP-type C4-dicarboxylate transport system permease small subunit
MKLKIVFFNIFLFLSFFSFVSAQGLQDAFTNAQDTAQKGSYSVDDGENLLTNSLNNVINIILSLLGIVFVILMIYGGITYMLARGNEEQTKKAKSLITQAIIGLFIVLAAYAITFFVFKFFI